MVTGKQPHPQPRQDNIHSLHTRPSRIQHTTCTTNRQHHTPHEHIPKNITTDSRPQTHIQQIHRKHNNKSTHNTTTQSTHINNMGETKGNDPCNTQHQGVRNKTKSQTPYHSPYITPKQHSPDQPVIPWPNSKQTNLPYYAHIRTKSM